VFGLTFNLISHQSSFIIDQQELNHFLEKLQIEHTTFMKKDSYTATRLLHSSFYSYFNILYMSFMRIRRGTKIDFRFRDNCCSIFLSDKNKYSMIGKSVDKKDYCCPLHDHHPYDGRSTLIGIISETCASNNVIFFPIRGTFRTTYRVSDQKEINFRLLKARLPL